MIARSVITESGYQVGGIPATAAQLTTERSLFPGPQYSMSLNSSRLGAGEMSKINWAKCIGIACILWVLGYFIACNVLGYLASR